MLEGGYIVGAWLAIAMEQTKLVTLYVLASYLQIYIKSRRMRLAGRVARMGEERGVYRVLVGKPEGRNHWGDLVVDGWIIL